MRLTQRNLHHRTEANNVGETLLTIEASFKFIICDHHNSEYRNLVIRELK